MALISSQLFFRCSGPGEEATVRWFHDGTYLGSGQVPITKPPKAIEYCVCCACFPNPTIAFKSRILLLVVGTEEYSSVPTTRRRIRLLKAIVGFGKHAQHTQYSIALGGFVIGTWPDP